MSIVITGANGEFGRSVLTSLLSRADQPVIATVREVQAAKDLPVQARPGSGPTPADVAVAF